MMTTIDELLKKSPPPWRVWDKANAPQGHCLVQDANGGAVHLGGSPQAICDAMNELVRLREALALAEKSEEWARGNVSLKQNLITSVEADNATLHARNVGLEKERDAHALESESLRHEIIATREELARLREVHAKQTPLFWEANAEVIRLRDSSMVQTHLRMAEKLEKAEAERDALKTRNAELEAFAERMKGAPGRLADELNQTWPAYDERVAIVRTFMAGGYCAAIYGEGPLPWDEKGGAK